MEHRDFYDNHPEALAQLNTLIAPPTMYQASSGSSLDDPSYGALQQARAEHDDNRHLDFNSASQVAQSLPPLHLSNVRVSAQPTSAEVRHLLRDTEYGYTLRIRFDTADGDSVVFDGNEFEPWTNSSWTQHTSSLGQAHTLQGPTSPTPRLPSWPKTPYYRGLSHTLRRRRLRHDRP